MQTMLSDESDAPVERDEWRWRWDTAPTKHV